VALHWRVELSQDNELRVHEYWLHHEKREYIPAVSQPVHWKRLSTDKPFLVEFGLSALLEL
jgi:hypothetical protein